MESHTTDTPTRTHAFITSWGKPIGFGIGALLLVLIVVTVASSGSAPGDLLYPTKLRVTENAIAMTKLTTTSKMEYDIARMETRLHELQELERDPATSTSTQRGLIVLAEGVGAQTERAVRRVERSSLTDGERIDALARVVHTTKALETLTGSAPEFETVEEHIEASRARAETALESLTESFVTTHDPETIGAFISAHLGILEEQLNTVAPGSDARRRATARIADAEDALRDSDIHRAVISILNAEEAIAVDGYLFASERGPVEGVDLPAVPEEG